nr:hypothetical protein [Sunxiuqinia sp.]
KNENKISKTPQNNDNHVVGKEAIKNKHDKNSMHLMGITRVDVETFYIISTKEVESQSEWIPLKERKVKNAYL